jgi:hypothetical protein
MNKDVKDELAVALATIRSQYILFVGPDDAIARAVLEIVDKALTLAEKKEKTDV